MFWTTIDIGALAQLSVPMTFNQSCYGIRGKESLNNGFLYYALKFEIQQFKNNASGVIFDAITTKTFDSIFIPIPPLMEQEKMLKEIENIEQEIFILDNTLSNTDTEKKSILANYLA